LLHASGIAESRRVQIHHRVVHLSNTEGRTINEHVRAVDVTPRRAASAKSKMLSCPDPVACYESGKGTLARQPAERAIK
jgi:hypothetical protein